MKIILTIFMCVSIITQTLSFSLIYDNLSMIDELSNSLKTVIINTDLALEELDNRKEIVYSVPELAQRVRAEPLVGLIKTDTSGIILECSNAIPLIVNFSTEELIGSSLQILMSEKDWKLHQKIIDSVVKLNPPENIHDERIATINGTKVKISARYLATEKQFIVSMKEK